MRRQLDVYVSVLPSGILPGSSGDSLPDATALLQRITGIWKASRGFGTTPNPLLRVSTVDRP